VNVVAKILLVEDEEHLLQPLQRWLKKEGHIVEATNSGTDALHILQVYKFDVIVLDWGLPDIDGLTVLKKFRGSGGVTPVIFLTGKSGLEDKREGLDSGADDYLSKPFEAEELSARIRALLRRPAGLLPTALTIDNVRIEIETKSVYVDGEMIRLGRKEFSVLEFLMRHPGRCFSSRELMEAVWPSDSDSNEDAVRSCVRQLRSKISTAGGRCIIDTIYGAGYIINAPKE
jgi:two-component system OmpR family response regulator